MNILFFLKPKSEVAFLEDTFTLRQAIEKMEFHRYAAIPILTKDGKYIGSITEGDILWYCKDNHDLHIQATDDIPLSKVSRRADYIPVTATSSMEGLISKAMNQNFVPVIDDYNNFIGIITRRDIIQYYYNSSCATSAYIPQITNEL